MKHLIEIDQPNDYIFVGLFNDAYIVPARRLDAY